MQTIAAIDVGSNAIRIDMGKVEDDWNVRTIEDLRLPVRLGQDALQ